MSSDLEVEVKNKIIEIHGSAIEAACLECQAKQNHHYRQFSASLLKRKLRVSLVLRKQLGLWKIS